MEYRSSQSKLESTARVTFLVVGGGIAGVTCAETLAICCPDEQIMLLTESNIIKTIANLEPVARYLQKFDVEERNVSVAGAGLANCIFTVIDQLQKIDAENRQVTTLGNRIIDYRYLCLCTGATPHLIEKNNEYVLGIRDTDSVLELQRHLQNAKRIVLVGNGGIASELAHELQNVEVHWVIKDNHIASTFVDPGAAYFFQKSFEGVTEPDVPVDGAVKRLRYAELQLMEAKAKEIGAALGPDWHHNFELSGAMSATPNRLIMHYKTQVNNISIDKEKQQNRVSVKLSSGQEIECDFVVSATGVEHRRNYCCSQPLAFAADGGISVNAMLETNVAGVYAAGDCCTAAWEPADNWFQMRLWTQARQMGAMAGRSMAAAMNGDTVHQDFCFELFGHVTKLFGFSVVLLGRYNGQGLGTNYEVLLRSTPGKEYVKFVLQNGRLRGAILIGNTELAETCENLILNGIDLRPFGDDILNPDIDIEDYFD